MSDENRERADKWLTDEGLEESFGSPVMYAGGVTRLTAELDAAEQRGRKKALEEAARLAETMRPHGGRTWSEEQAACFEALSDCAGNIRSLLGSTGGGG